VGSDSIYIQIRIAQRQPASGTVGNDVDGFDVVTAFQCSGNLGYAIFLTVPSGKPATRVSTSATAASMKTIWAPTPKVELPSVLKFWV